MVVNASKNFAVCGIWDSKQEKPIYLGVYPSLAVGRREVFRLAHKAEYVSSSLADDFFFAEQLADGEYDITPLKDIASAYGVCYFDSKEKAKND